MMKAEVLMLLVQKVSQSWKQLLMWMDKTRKHAKTWFLAIKPGTYPHLVKNRFLDIPTE